MFLRQTCCERPSIFLLKKPSGSTSVGTNTREARECSEYPAGFSRYCRSIVEMKECRMWWHTTSKTIIFQLFLFNPFEISLKVLWFGFTVRLSVLALTPENILWFSCHDADSIFLLIDIELRANDLTYVRTYIQNLCVQKLSGNSVWAKNVQYVSNNIVFICSIRWSQQWAFK